jgi:hypothetical protein
MTRKSSMLGGGGIWASSLVTGTAATGLTATGATQATALPLVDDVNRITTTALSTGVIVPAMQAGDNVCIANHGANALLVYPPLGGTIGNGATNAGVSVPLNKSADVHCIDPLTYSIIVGA